MRDSFQALVREGGAALQVQAGHAAQRCERSQAVVDERHVPPPVQAQRPAQRSNLREGLPGGAENLGHQAQRPA